MTEKTLSQLKSGFMKAHKAGNKAQAKIYADEIKRRRALSSSTVTAAPTQEPMLMPDESSGEIPDVPEEAKRVMSGVMRELGQGLTFGGAGELVGGYEGAKAKLFEGLGSDHWAILNADDPYSQKMIANSKARQLWCRVCDVETVESPQETEDHPTFCTATILNMSSSRSYTRMAGPWGSYELDIPLIESTICITRSRPSLQPTR